MPWVASAHHGPANLIAGTQTGAHAVSCTVPAAGAGADRLTLTATGEVWLDEVRLASPTAPGLAPTQAAALQAVLANPTSRVVSSAG
jgi:hypothetical protein